LDRGPPRDHFNPASRAPALRKECDRLRRPASIRPVRLVPAVRPHDSRRVREDRVPVGRRAVQDQAGSERFRRPNRVSRYTRGSLLRRSVGVRPSKSDMPKASAGSIRFARAPVRGRAAQHKRSQSRRFNANLVK
jgi:hypothetical protein